MLKITEALSIRLEKLVKSQDDVHVDRPKDEQLQALWTKHTSETEYPLRENVPKWIIWSLLAVIKEIHVANDSESKQDMVNTLEKEKEKWPAVFQDTANPTADSFGSPEATFTAEVPKWTTERLRQRLKTQNGLTTLDLQDCALKEIPEAAFEMKETLMIKVVDISGNFINTLPRKLSQMISMKQLNATCNDVASIEVGALGKQLETLGLGGNRLVRLPDDFSSCGNLRMINLSYNQLTQLPQNHDKLEVLDVRGNANLDSFDADAKGEVPIKSKFTLNEDVTSTMTVNQATATTLSRLVFFHAHECGFTEIPKSIINSKTIQYLNLGHNASTLKNKVITVQSEIGNMSKLVELYLENNDIIQLPKELTYCKMLKKLNVEGNPLTIPPEVISRGVKAIMNYLNETTESDAVLRPRFRVPILGNTGVGKSSLLETLMAGQSRLKKKSDRTHVVDHKVWKTKAIEDPHKTLEIQFDDFGGHDCYKHTHVFFLSRKCTPLLCIRSDQFTDATFDNTVLPWLETTSSAIPNATIHMLLTQTDNCKPVDVKVKVDMLLHKVREHEQAVRKQIEQKLATIHEFLRSYRDAEKRTEFELQVNILKQHLSQRPRLPTQVLAVSSKCMDGIESVKHNIISVFENPDKFPEERIPQSWFDLLHEIQDIAHSQGLRFLTRNKVEAAGKEIGLTKERVSFALEYLHLCGDLLWYSDGPILKDIVFPDPNKLVEVIKTLISHDIKEIQYKDNWLKYLSKDEFHKHKTCMTNKGLISKELLNCLWHHFDLNKAETNALKELLIRFDLCYAIPKSENVFDASQADQLMFPWLLPMHKPDLPSIDDTTGYNIQINLEFASHCPVSFFPALVVRLNKFVGETGSRQDWQKGTYANDGKGNMFLLELIKRQGGDRVLLTVWGTNLKEMWHSALPIELDMRGLLSKWPGVLATFGVPCPRCKLENDPDPCLLSAVYLWKPCKGRLRCQKKQNRVVDTTLIYPSEEVLAGLPSKIKECVGSSDESPITKKASQDPTERLNYQKVSSLVTGYGPELLREILEASMQPLSLEQWLLSYQLSVHQLLKDRPMITYGRLYPVSDRPVQFSDLTFTDLMDLFTHKNIKVEPPKTGWIDKNPHEEDDTIGANIVRIRTIHDIITNHTYRGLTDNAFVKLWEKTEITIYKLGGEKERVSRIKEGELY